MSNTALLAVIVAGISVVASVIMQLRTLHASRENSHETLRVTARATNLQHAIDGLTDDLSQYMAVSYFIDTGYRHAMNSGAPWPGEYLNEVKQEDVLYARIRLRLNPDDALDAHLLKAIDKLRRTDATELWILRRDNVVATAQAVFRDKWTQLLELQPQRPAIPPSAAPADSLAAVVHETMGNAEMQ